MTDAQRKRYEEFCEHERTNGAQFPVMQRRPNLVTLSKLAFEAESDYANIRQFEIAQLGFETNCLINYVVMLEEQMDILGQIRRNLTQEEVNGQMRIRNRQTFAQKMRSFFREIFQPVT